MDIKQIPVLSEDELWLGFYKNHQNFALRRKYQRLVRLLSHQKEIIENIRKIKKDKRESLNRVFMLSQKAYGGEDGEVSGEMEAEKNRIEALNSQLFELGARRQRLKEETVNANFALLKQTVRVAYNEIKKYERQQQDITGQIDALKASLNDMIDKKHSLEEEKSSLYRLVHALIGKEEADKLDKDYLE